MAIVHVVATAASSGRDSPPSSTDVVAMSSMVLVMTCSTAIDCDSSVVANTTAWRPSTRLATSSGVYVTTCRAGTTIGSIRSVPSAIPRYVGCTSTSSSVGL